ncbi:MAG: MotA/TolQ/ExbB proton channel family protein [Halarcobacter sp.]
MSEFNSRRVNSFPRFLVIASVPIILFIFVLLGYIKYIPLKVEIHSLIIIFLILIIFLFFIPHNAWYTFSILKNKIFESKDDIDIYLNSKELTLNNTKKSYASLDEYFKSFLRDLRNDNFANIASSIFPTLGILGTFTAIAISMPDFTVDSKQALENEITLLLSGVGTAFYASIYGIFLSIWWVFFEKRGLTKVDSEINFLKDSYKEFIWTKDEIEIAKILESQKESFSKKLESLLTPDFIFKMDDLVKNKLEHLEDINKSFSTFENKISDSYINYYNILEKSAEKHKKIVDSLDKIKKNIDEINNSFEKSLENQNHNQKAIKAETYSVLSSLELVSSDLKELGKELLNGK